MIEPTTIDFETESIARRPHYPPRPVGVSIKKAGERQIKYWSWGHPTKNNCTFEEGRARLAEAWCGRAPLLFHNGKFDVDVAETHCGMPRLWPEQIHDTLFLLFLHNPHALSLSLKPVAASLLNMPPEEADAVRNWLLEHRVIRKQQASKSGAFICKAPGDLVGRYANGDILRTYRLFKLLHQQIIDRGMEAAYRREQQLMPILLDTERQGIRCDWKRLERDVDVYGNALELADNWLRKHLKEPELNLDADAEVGEAFARAGVIADDGWVYTKTGKRSTSKRNMSLDKFENERVAQVWGYRQRLRTCLSTFMLPWLEMCRDNNGMIFTTWNQVRQAHGNDGSKGARTGRLSSSPNFQNIPRDFEDNNDGWIHPVWFAGLPHLPKMRGYLLPDVGHEWVKRDYAQQELRILAHFENGALLDKYNSDPDYDMHNDLLTYCNEVAGIDINRSGVKVLNFGDIYGMGIGELARKAKIEYQVARRLKMAKRAAMPDFHTLDEDIKQRGRNGIAIHTWGGREYECEDGHYVEKFRRHMTFEYKMLNYLIQGSAADCTKEAIIRYFYHPDRQARFLLSVHDELNISAPRERWREEMNILRECMEGIEFDTIMFSDGSHGRNWAALTDVKEKRQAGQPYKLPQRDKFVPMHGNGFGYKKGLRDVAVAEAKRKRKAELAVANFVLAEQGLRVGKRNQVVAVN